MTSKRGLIVAFALLLAAVAVAFTAGLLSRDVSGNRVSLAELEEEGIVFLNKHHIYVVWNEGEPLALSADAQHLGDEVWYCPSSGMFEAPAHGEKFDGRGYYFAGPARSGLARFPVRVTGDELMVDVVNPSEGPPRGEGPPHDPEGAFCEPGGSDYLPR